MIIDSWVTLETTSKRTIVGTNGKQLVGMKISADKAKLSYGDKDCTLLSLGMYEAGASANTINKPSVSSTELASETVDAPLDQEYLDGEAFICLFENHLVLSPTDTLRIASIINFLRSLLAKAGYNKEASLVDIQQIANIETFKTIEREGVKNIIINSSAYVSTYQYLARVDADFEPSSMVKKLKKMALNCIDVLKNYDEDGSISDKENLNARIVLAHDGRSVSDESKAGESRLNDTAISLIDSDMSGYTIVTKKNKKISHEEFVIRDKVRVTEHGKSVKIHEMWAKLISTLERFNKDGYLEQ